MENEGLPPLVENKNRRYWIYLFLIFSIVLLTGGLIQFVISAAIAFIYDLDLGHLEGLASGTFTGPEYVPALYAMRIGDSLSFIAPAFLIPPLFKENTREFLHINSWAKPRMYIIGCVLFLVAIPLISWMAEWNKSIFDSEIFNTYKSEAKASEDRVNNLVMPLLLLNGIGYLMLNILVFAILPAIGEELILRGVIQKHLFNWTGKIHLSIFLAAFIFSFIHFQWMGFFPRLVLGMALGYLLYYSGTIWVSISAHAFNNTLAVIGYYLKDYDQNDSILSEKFQPSTLYVTISAVLTGITFYLLIRMRTRPEEIPS